jgi:hypothetical protein
LGWIALILSTSSALAASPELTQFAQGVEVIPQSTRPLVQVALPDAIYQTVTRANLADVSVFNSAGELVPHALCAAAENETPTISLVELPVIELRATPPTSASGTQVDVQTAGGTRIEMRDPNAAAHTSRTGAHVIDATGVATELRAIEFVWHTADGASEATVRIEASDDLDRWETLLNATTLLRAGKEGQLRRERVPLPQRRYRYLRVEQVDGGLPLTVESARAEQVAVASSIEPQWFALSVQGQTHEGPWFATHRLAPIRYARVKLPGENMTVQLTLQSRANEKSAWITRWSGEMYTVLVDGVRKLSAPATFAVTTDREWRLQLPRRSVSNIDVELGYRPAMLRFVAQGTGPFTIAYGSAQLGQATALRCAQLLSDVEPKALREFIGEGALGSSRTLGGEDALKPLPKKTPTRLIVLWTVMILSVALLVAMAVSLLKRVRPTQ